MIEKQLISRRKFVTSAVAIAGAALGASIYASTKGDNPLAAEIIKLITLLPGSEIFPTEKAKALVAKVNDKNDGSIARNIVSHNIFILGDNIFVLPLRGFYRDMFFRDYRFASNYIDVPELDLNVLEQFERDQHEDGRIPTAISFVGREAAFAYSSDDETTLLYIIHASNLAMKNSDVLTSDRINSINKAWGFISKHVEDNKYISPKGARRGHIDSYIFPENDVIIQNQGLYAVALRSLIELNKTAGNQLQFLSTGKELTAAKVEYQKPVNKYGYLPLSSRVNAPAVGGVFPEYLMMTMFRESLLSDTQVKNILDLSPRLKTTELYDYPILCTPMGESLDPNLFLNKCPPDTYQNRTIWPIWQQLLLSVAELHNVIGNGYRKGMIERLTILRYPEWFTYQQDKSIHAENEGYLWTVDIHTQHKYIDIFKGLAVI